MLRDGVGLHLCATLALLLVSGCVVTDYATSKTPAAVSEQFIRQGPTTWGGPKIYRIGNSEMNNGSPGGTSYKVDPGPTVIKVWYYGNRDGLKGIFTQTDMVEIPVTLEANAHYEIRASAEEKTVAFTLCDLGSGQEVARVADVPIVRGPSRLVRGSVQAIPIFIPAH